MSESTSACTAAAAATAAAAYMSMNPNLTQAALDHYRLQLYNYASYADRFRYTHPSIATHFALAAGGGAGSPYGHHHNQLAHHHHHHNAEGMFAAALASPYAKFDPRAFRLHQEEPKPQHSYIGLIGMAILSSPDKKLVLSDIYQYILDNYAYFRSRGPGWRNSIRHNLSLNDCFIKSGRSANGKGHYWAIHPANLEDFKKGDFRRRKAQRRVRKHMGLAVPDDEDSVSPPPQPAPTPANGPPARPLTPSGVPVNINGHLWSQHRPKPDSTTAATSGMAATMLHRHHVAMPLTTTTLLPILAGRRRQFDMESLLAPDRPTAAAGAHHGVAAAMLRSVEAHHQAHLQNRSTSATNHVTAGAPRYVQTDTLYPRRQSLINGGRLMMVQMPDHLNAPHGRPNFDSATAAHLKDGGGWKMGGDVIEMTGRRQSAVLSSPVSRAHSEQSKEEIHRDDDPNSNRHPYLASGNKKFKIDHSGCDVTDEAKNAVREDGHDADTDMLESRSWNGEEEEEEDGQPDHERESCFSDSDHRTVASPCSPGGGGGSESARLSPATSARTSGRPQSGDGSGSSCSPTPDSDKEFSVGNQHRRSPTTSPFAGYSSPRSGPAARALVCVAAAAAAAASSSSGKPSGHLCHVSMCDQLADTPWHKSFLQQHQNGAPNPATTSVSPQPFRLGPLQQHHPPPSYGSNVVQCLSGTPSGLSPSGMTLGSSFSNDINNQLTIATNVANADGPLQQTQPF